MDSSLLDTHGKPLRPDQLDANARHRRRLSWFTAELHRQAANRRMMARCERAYDSEPLDPEMKRKIEARGQVATNHNEVKPQIDWLIGTERRMRVDFNVSPRESLEGSAVKDAEVKTKLLKWIDDTNRAGFERSYVADDGFKAGMGWLEVAVRGDSTDNPIYKGHVPWRFMLHDSIGNPRRDLTDCRYLFRIKPVDLDIAMAYFPDKQEALIRAAREVSRSSSLPAMMLADGGMIDIGMMTGDDWQDERYGISIDTFNPRERVLLLECWSYEPDFKAKNRKSSSSTDRAPLIMQCSIMTEHETLLEGQTPYRHNRYPFIPLWMYRNKATGLPYGPAKSLLAKQEALDRAMNKAMYEIAVDQVIIEESAINPKVMTLTEIRAEASDPSGMIILKDGGLAKFRKERGIANAQAHLEIVDRLKTSMQQESGVTAENLGAHTAAQSGKAIGLKQDQGSLLTAELFDNILLAHQMEGEITLSVAEQYIVQPMVASVKGERKQLDSVEINKPNPDWQPGMPEDQKYINDITLRQAQFVVGEQPWKATAAQAAFESMMELLGDLAPFAPQVVINMLDLVFEYADIPNKETVLQRIRAVTGQPGPDGTMTPDQIQAKQQATTMAQAEFEAKLATLKAQVAEATAKGNKLSVESVVKSLEGIYMAAQAAQVIGAAPLITPIADELLKSAGYQDQSGSVNTIDPAAVPQLPAPQPQIPPPRMGAGPLVGHESGIETAAPDGVNPQLEGAPA